MNPQVDAYLARGCGRCPLVGTPQCKVNTWREALQQLRKILLDCGLSETLKWSQPCYTFQQKNVVLMSAFKAYCALSFFKGALLKDPAGILHKAGPNSQAARLIRFTSPQQVLDMQPLLRAYIQEAIEIEKAGQKVRLRQQPEPMPEELKNILEEQPRLKAAFEALTPGRQRGYILYFSAPKQSKTRRARIEKYQQQILAGKGMHDR
ncbi:MAG: hypothetical protein D6730_10645 [Bacteroidetes bacterium]|nr:MAG: hypothetical protein D6730_10645 [Bacteroidota bacterium]